MTNKCMIKALLMFTAGAASGSLVTNAFLKTKYETLAIEQMEAYREKILEQVDGDIVDHIDVPDDVVYAEEMGYTDEDKSVEQAMQESDEKYGRSDEDYGRKKDPEKLNKIEYNAMSKSYSANMEKMKSDLIGKKPYIITGKSYDEDMEDYDKVDLHYYLEDEVLTDENEEVIADLIVTIGQDTLMAFENGVETIFVRNDILNVDYEITSVDLKYANHVLGFPND